MASIAPIAPMLLSAGICALLVWVTCSHLKFSVEQTGVHVRFCGFVVKKIAFTNIEFADRTWCWWNEHYSNTLNPKRIVRIRRRSGWCRNLILTPPNPKLFLDELSLHGVEVR